MEASTVNGVPAKTELESAVEEMEGCTDQEPRIYTDGCHEASSSSEVVGEIAHLQDEAYQNPADLS